MKIFDSGTYRAKVNFVDKKNTLVGYDMGQSCCEAASWMITTDEPPNYHPLEFKDELCEISREDLEDYVFDTKYTSTIAEHPNLDSGGFVVFRLTKPRRKKAIYLTLFNHHNGYYSHGFEYDVGGKRALEGGL
jgi:hypothetical protein